MLVRNYYTGINTSFTETNRQNINDQKNAVSFGKIVIVKDLDLFLSMASNEFLQERYIELINECILETLVSAINYEDKQELIDKFLIDKFKSLNKDDNSGIVGLNKAKTEEYLAFLHQFLPESYIDMKKEILRDYESDKKSCDYLNKTFNKIEKNNTNAESTLLMKDIVYGLESLLDFKTQNEIFDFLFKYINKNLNSDGISCDYNLDPIKIDNRKSEAFFTSLISLMPDSYPRISSAILETRKYKKDYPDLRKLIIKVEQRYQRSR